ncbi:MAG TPA: hypothetical protein VJ576_19360 [Rhodocyclaceae bacterium]|nr:hypothetical protein [Rhodocyclaceae bacterium]
MAAPRTAQGGNALLVALLVLSVGGAYFALGGLSGIRERLQRDEQTQAVLAQAKEALIGFAATYREQHPAPGPVYNEVFGFLPCPDTNNDGVAEASCDDTDVSVIGRLPWRTLGLPPLRDSAGECLWYAVSGRVKNGSNPKTAAMNWDTIGQFLLQDAAGNLLAGASAHDRPLAVVIAPGAAIGAQVRPSAGASECGGSNVVSAYLDGADPIYAGVVPAANADSTLAVATDDSIRAGTNNDRAQWLNADDVFRRVRARRAFADDVNGILDEFKLCLDRVANPPTASGAKGFDGVFDWVTSATNCAPYDSPGSPKRQFLEHWRNNFLYTKPATAPTFNGGPCTAVLLFGGARVAGQSRGTPAEIATAANYLEGANAAAFPDGTGYVAAQPSAFNAASPGTDLIRCITGYPAGSISFAANFADFAAAGNGVSLDTTYQTISLAGTASATGGCFWYPNPLPLAGRTLRAYYRYAFAFPDTYALTGSGTDRGNGFTFQLVRSDLPNSPVSLCGRTIDMGALTIGTPGAGGGLSVYSFTIESDVRQDVGNLDPSGNHTAILAYGNLAHTPTNGTPTTACNASAKGCLHTPANKFEESPTPAEHNQRIEILSGCNSACSACDPTAHGVPNNHVRIRVWVDCADCTDTAVDYPGEPNMQRCTVLDSPLASAYIGFTGGFRTGSGAQGVTLRDFVLLSQ